MSTQRLVAFVEQVLATAQAGLTYSKDPYDIGRFKALREAAASYMADGDAVTEPALAHWFELDEGYPTPKLDVRAFILDAGQRILLIREKVDGCWTLPGGWCDIGESPKRCVEREVMEEAGLACRAVRLLALFDKHCHPHPPQLPHAYKAFFLCEATGGSLLQDTDETAGAAYFAPGALPALSTNRVLASQLALLHRRVQEQRLDALFD
ncbi:MAG TPA: NUDIX hydrolase [Holophaga sp.]|nr:NUDIX hydrolase [Holophaga sp.]